MHSRAQKQAIQRAVRTRFWAELALGSAAAVLGILTTFWHDWIEAVFGVDPDHGNGTLEWGIVATLLLTAAVLFVLARIEWRLAGLKVSAA